MTKEFSTRVKDYFDSIAKALQEDAQSTSLFSNKSDIGQGKEAAIAGIFEAHVPKSCDVFLGGQIFNNDGLESGQIDVIITDGNGLRFHNRSEKSKSITCIDGALGAISVKSSLDGRELEDALTNIASIPQGTTLNEKNSNPFVDFSGFSDGLLKVVFGFTGPSADTLAKHIEAFYSKNPTIPVNRRPNYIHVAGKYCWVRLRKDEKMDDGSIGKAGMFGLRDKIPDVFFLAESLITVEKLNRFSRHIFYDYTPLYAKIT